MSDRIGCVWCSPCKDHDADDPAIRAWLEAERAVIEAAKAWVNKVDRGFPGLTQWEHDLSGAVEALLAAEGE